MQVLEFEDFFERLRPYAVYGLAEEEAKGLVDKGRETCEYFERTVFSMWYAQYKESKLPFPVFARGLLESWAKKVPQQP